MAGIKINGDTSGSTTITAPNTGTDETIELSTALASKLPYSYGTATPSTTDSGFLWYDSNSTPAAPKFWDGSAFQPLSSGGLQLITTASASGDSSLSIDNCFSGTFNVYRMVFKQVNINTGTPALRFRLRASGTDNTSNEYYTQQGLFNGTSVTATRAQDTSGVIGVFGGNQGFGIADIVDPFVARRKQVMSSWQDNTTVPISRFVAAGVNVSSSFDGITFFPTSGTMTFNVAIYGYED